MSTDGQQSNATMSVQEIARKLGISPGVAYPLAKENKLPVPTIRVGKRLRFSRAALDAVLAAQHEEREAA
jgi:excisionase family DNA binding protein